MTARADPLHTARDVESNIITCDTGLGSGPRAINADRGGLHRKLGRFWKSPLWSRRIGEKSSLVRDFICGCYAKLITDVFQSADNRQESG